ncbi:MAG: histidine kinase [Flavobacteriales bacterium]|nr:histidine kinase [Flavobacteriales bacterium]
MNIVQPSTERSRRTVYWTVQLLAWSLLVTLFGLFLFKHDQLSIDQFKVLVLFYFTGIGISHWFRHVIIRNGWLERDIGYVTPRLSFVALLLSIAAFLVMAVMHDLFFREYPPLLVPDPLEVLLNIINWTLLLFIWSLGYFAYTYFVRSRREEIRSLRLATANRENQLNTLRAQMNPHFMFNALNGIRALVDEDPDQAKKAITQLSAILRNAMATVKRNVVPLGEEIDIVKAYLELEKMRYEERLRVHFSVPAELEREQVPPMLLQTLVENAVRHGIAPLLGGGDLHVIAQRTAGGLALIVRNTGRYTPGKSQGSGIGLRNTRKRLDMLYGGQANFHIADLDGMVESRVDLPARGEQATINS